MDIAEPASLAPRNGCVIRYGQQRSRPCDCSAEGFRLASWAQVPSSRTGLHGLPSLRIPMKGATDSNPKPATFSGRKPTTHPHGYRQGQMYAHIVAAWVGASEILSFLSWKVSRTTTRAGKMALQTVAEAVFRPHFAEPHPSLAKQAETGLISTNRAPPDRPNGR